MTLADLRKLAIRKQSRIRFVLSNGMECVVSEDGIARVPALRSVPDFNLERELSGATAFLMEPGVPAGAKGRPPAKAVPLGRAALAAMARDSHVAVAAHDEHDDE